MRVVVHSGERPPGEVVKGGGEIVYARRPEIPIRMSVASPDLEIMQPLLDLLRGRRTVVLAGAGCSTESGIPDYRSPESLQRARKPIQYQEFVRSEAARARYWARSSVGWIRFSAARPNAGHAALAKLEDAGVVRGIITQNVDGLHHAAGSRRVVELHGSLATVRCLGCGAVAPRGDFQHRLMALNAEWSRRLDGQAQQAPDGDAELPDWAMESFQVPACETCGGASSSRTSCSSARTCRRRRWSRRGACSARRRCCWWRARR
jgi:NAD-dependent SIR2 family protein deacetylase